MQVLLRYLPAIGTVVGLITAGLAYRTYYRQARLERLKWLQQLYDSFYNSERYKPVRQIIDFDDMAEVLSLLQKSDYECRQLPEKQRNLLDQFTDYLNFFEWIAFLEWKRQLNFKDIDVMFNYYLKRVVEIDNKHENQISKYMSSSGYEQFRRLLVKHFSLLDRK